MDAFSTDTILVAAAVGVVVTMVLMAGQFDNHLWRYLCIGAWWKTAPVLRAVLLDIHGVTHDALVWHVFLVLVSAAILFVPLLQRRNKRQGCVVITGADSGMGQTTVLHLAQTNLTSDTHYDAIFALAYNAKQCRQALEEQLQHDVNKEKILKSIQILAIDVTKDASVQQAAHAVKDYLVEKKTTLTGVVCYHGVGYNGPIQYMPLSMWQTQMDVNFFGHIRMVQSFLPLLDHDDDTTVPKRFVVTGTGGGPCSPCPPLLAAYMASKFAGEAFCQSLRQELFMTHRDHIQVSVINPGFVKPTRLMEDGKMLMDRMWQHCEQEHKSSIAKDTYGRMLEHFVNYADLQPGTHVSQVANACEHALLAACPRSSYKVGIDSKLAPIVGMMPTGMREWMARHGIYGVLSPAGTVQGYRV